MEREIEELRRRISYQVKDGGLIVNGGRVIDPEKLYQYIVTNYGKKNTRCCQRFCHWCGQRLTTDVAN